MKILLVGAKGQLGRDCQKVLISDHCIIPADLPEFDATKIDQVRLYMELHHPDVILNCAAFTRVDDCETQKELAYSLNADIPAILAYMARSFGCHLIHISTDYVFDGKKAPFNSYTEKDETHPLSIYGMSKIVGENTIVASNAKHTILRTAWLYGRNGNNFPKAILKRALQGKELTVVSDQYGTPTWTWRLAKQIRVVIEQHLEGIFHATDEGFATWYDFANLFLKEMNVPHFITPCSTEDWPTKTKRPMNSILENSRLKIMGFNIMHSWEKDVKEFVTKYRDELIEECKPK